eukprot:TRINITY_DN13301_c0_g1_i1.p1 TRINITY_DN13301_c0_g1~~TRINITY_DN13301_c0_g1_i1.p1  ORF type:complete len:446 (+),score=53.97 TRINITY_DN13301_c0_g1_i1:56-1339(+)
MDGITTKDLDTMKADLKCKVCQELFEIPVVLPCSHLFCKRCVGVILSKHKSDSTCPMCREPFSRRSFYEISSAASLCKKLRDIGDQLGVADITMTQVSQPFVFKPFVPLQHPPKPKTTTLAGDMLSQCLRFSKSQLPPGEEESDEDESESSLERQKHPHPLQKAFKTQWLCSQAATKNCLSGMKRNVRTNRECYTCKECNYHLCLKCFSSLGYSPHDSQVVQEPSSQSSSSSDASGSSSSSSSSSFSSDDDKCFLCRIPSNDQKRGCKDRLASISSRHSDITDGVLWKASAPIMNSKLAGLLGPYPVTWRKGTFYREEKSTETRRLSVKVHDLCLLWSPQTRISESGTIVPKSIPPAVRQAHNKICHACGKYGASLTCKKTGCNRSFHVPCGLFTSEIGKIDSETYTIFCKDHAESSSAQLKRRKTG